MSVTSELRNLHPKLSVSVGIMSTLSGLTPATVLHSRGGTGKSVLVRTFVKDLRVSHKWVYGKLAPLELFRLLYFHRNDVIVFDEAKHLFQYPNSIELLKGVIEEGVAEWLTTSEKVADVPQRFRFRGSLIFLLNNIKFGDDVKALISRTLYVNYNISNKEFKNLVLNTNTYTNMIYNNISISDDIIKKYKHLQRLQPSEYKSYIMKHKKTILNTVNSLFGDEGNDLNYRTYKLSMKIYVFLKTFLKDYSDKQVNRIFKEVLQQLISNTYELHPTVRKHMDWLRQNTPCSRAELVRRMFLHFNIKKSRAYNLIKEWEEAQVVYEKGNQIGLVFRKT